MPAGRMGLATAVDRDRSLVPGTFIHPAEAGEAHCSRSGDADVRRHILGLGVNDGLLAGETQPKSVSEIVLVAFGQGIPGSLGGRASDPCEVAERVGSVPEPDDVKRQSRLFR